MRTDEQPCLRIRGELVPISTKPFKINDILDIACILTNQPDAHDKVKRFKELDGGFALPGLCRLRFNFYRYADKLGIILRIVHEKIPSIDELHLPKVIKKISDIRRGLVLVTGPTGSGKSTTLAAMINQINHTRHCHVVTVEDPIEYLHPQNNARVSQREVGRDTENFSMALRSALRQDPDVILIGEMRDPETVQIALKAAETGHAVFSTVHTTDALSTIGRVISMFPPEQQEDVRNRLAINLHATISQRMLKKEGGKGIVIAQEIMVTNPGVKDCISGKDPLERLSEVIKQGYGPGGNGSQSFDQHLMALLEARQISKDTALAAATSEGDFIQQLEFE
jgi:twitching motility protein PilT